MIDEPMDWQKNGGTPHEVWVQDGHVCMSNTSDLYYVRAFRTQVELDAFIDELKKAGVEAFS